MFSSSSPFMIYQINCSEMLTHPLSPLPWSTRKAPLTQRQCWMVTHTETGPRAHKIGSWALVCLLTAVVSKLRVHFKLLWKTKSAFEANKQRVESALKHTQARSENQSNPLTSNCGTIKKLKFYSHESWTASYIMTEVKQVHSSPPPTCFFSSPSLPPQLFHLPLCLKLY